MQYLPAFPTIVHRVCECLDFLFPPTQDALTVRSLKAERLVLLMRQHTHADVHALLPYADDAVRACIYEAKFHQNKAAMTLLAGVLHTHLHAHMHADAVLIPIPLSRLRFRSRGYNQVAEVAKRACDSCDHVTLSDELLVRHQHTRPQTELTKAEREANVIGVFSLQNERNARLIEGARIILLDDVVTTGATMRAARAALVPYKPSSITCIALAH